MNVLFVNGGPMRRGGIESFMMNYFRHMDREQVHIDFAVRDGEEGAYDREILNAGSKLYKLPMRSRHPIAYERQLTSILNSNRYQIVHSHVDAMSGWILKIAQKCGVPVRIAHSHNTDLLTNNKFKVILNNYAKSQIPKYATHAFACSKAAGDWLFGKKLPYQVIHNAIDTDQYAFNPQKREFMRKHARLENNFVIGHVGRFDYQKNHEFLIEIMRELIKFRPEAKLVLIGEGEGMPSIRDMVHKYKLDHAVLFVGGCDCVNEWYHAFDVFVMPSRFEGLCFAGIEAQANGLKCLISDRVSREVDLTDSTVFLPIEHVENWTDVLKSCNGDRNQSALLQVISAGYSIQHEAKKLQSYYLQTLEK